MSAKFAGKNGHATISAFYDYNRPEHELATGSPLVSVYRGDGRLVGRCTRQQLELIAKGAGVRSRVRANSSPGQELGLTLPASVVAAMKKQGLLNAPDKAFPILDHATKPGMRKLNESAYGRTTNGKPVKVDLYYAVMHGFVNRAGEIAPQANVWVLGYGQSQKGRHYAIDSRRLYRAQKSLQAAWNMGIASRLLREGIVCVPKGNSIRAMGVRAQTKRTQQVNAKLKSTQFTGPKARARATRSSRPPKPKVSWADALNNFAYTVSAKVTRGLKTLSELGQERLAQRCVKSAFRYHNLSGAARYSKHDVYATGAHLALPHVSPEVYDRAFARLSNNPERMKAEVAKLYPDGNTLYMPRAQLKLEAKAAKVLSAGQQRTKGGLTRPQIARALAGKGLNVTGYAAVQRIADPRHVVLDPKLAADTKSIRLTAEAYKRRGKKVYVVGKEAGNALGTVGESAFGFAEKLERTPHLTALWRGLRSKGTLAERLTVAERIRAKKPPRHLTKNSLIVVSGGLEDTRALLRIVSAARKSGSKVVFTGAATQKFADLAKKHSNSQRSRGAHP